MHVLFVCTGNICRSPTAEAVVRAKAQAAGLPDLELDSVGTTGYHVGEPPDRRAQIAARSRGYDLSDLRARQLGRGDFARFDLLLGMDRGHIRQMERMAPQGTAGKLKPFMRFAPDLSARGADEVPDPYYGEARGFDVMMDLIEAAADGLIDAIKRGGAV
jgi:protein-tyrosine phosphatase